MPPPLPLSPRAFSSEPIIIKGEGPKVVRAHLLQCYYCPLRGSTFICRHTASCSLSVLLSLLPVEWGCATLATEEDEEVEILIKFRGKHEHNIYANLSRKEVSTLGSSQAPSVCSSKYHCSACSGTIIYIRKYSLLELIGKYCQFARQGNSPSCDARASSSEGVLLSSCASKLILSIWNTYADVHC